MDTLVRGIAMRGDVQLVLIDTPGVFAPKKRLERAMVAAAWSALEGADALFVVTEWNDYRHPDFDRMKSLMKTPVVFDGRNVFDPKKMRELGFTYHGIGRA